MKKTFPIVAGVLSLTLAFSLTSCFTVEEKIPVDFEPTSSYTANSSPENQSQSQVPSDIVSDIVSDTASDNNTNAITSDSNTNTVSDNASSKTTSTIKVEVEFNGDVEKMEASYKLYYVDSINGNDDNDGRTPDTAWKSMKKVNKTQFDPGSKILFKAGGIWDEPLIPQSSGTKGKHIVFDMYGKGNKPIIIGDGENAAVSLSALEYVEVRNFEITNTSEFEGNRKGVYVTAGGQVSAGVYRDGGISNHIYLINLDIHDVSAQGGERWNGGIIFISQLAKNPVAFNDILIQGCTVKDTEGNGITFASDYNKRTGVYWSTGDYFPSSNVTVRNNFIANCAGDGIYINCVNYPLMEYNTLTNTSYVGGGAYAGMWPHNSSNAVMQYNEAYDIKKVGGDGMGFDVDINCERTVVQYNYSHDNEGGFLLLCTDGDYSGFNRDITVRYNISQNDMDALFTLSGPISDVKIYNNSFYVKDGLKKSTRLIGSYNWAGSGKSPLDARFTNNIFYMNCTGEDFLINRDVISFDTNVFYGSYDFSKLPQKNSIYADPKFVNPGSGKIGINTVDGYKLKEGSPCIDAGKTLLHNGGKDYFGIQVPQNGKFDIGASEYVK